MKVLLILMISGFAELTLAQAQGIKLIAFTGGGIIVKCVYNTGYERNMKSFCKGNDNCKYDQKSQNTDKRFTLYDTNNHHFLVLMRSLTEKDSGKYQCLVELSQGIHKNTTFNLEVKKDPCCGQVITQSGNVNETIEVSCKYPSSVRGNSKSFYKQHPIILSEGTTSKSPQQPAKLSIVDDSRTEAFQVTIRRLTLADAGVYWCGVGTGGNTGSINLITEVQLHVIDPNHQTSPRTSPYPRSSDNLASSQPANLSTAGDHVPLIVSLTLVVLVTGLGGVTLYVYKKRKAQGHTSSTAVGHQRPPQRDCVYEEINDPDGPSDPSSSAIGSPDSPDYATVTFHKGADQQTQSSSAGTPREVITSEYATIQPH
ncbi:CMRF35-like molecule 8 [Sardina pilchardus]|uniref:CMRF35-like molecule 8 n=1 Tax=Sardina pilchardus TaxID=27697 RepID=UPI002E113818